MDQAYRERRREQFTHLGTGELLSAGGFVFAAYAWSLNIGSRAGVVALWAALTPLVVVLLQAGVYWLAARSWVGRGAMPSSMARVYRAFRILDVVLLVAAAVVVVLSWPPEPGLAVLVVLVWLFAVVEYLNYFVVRLSYPPRQWFSTVGQWRTPRLVRDLASPGWPHAG